MRKDPYVPFIELGPNVSLGIRNPQVALKNLSSLAIKCSGGIEIVGEEHILSSNDNLLFAINHESYLDGPYIGASLLRFMDEQHLDARFHAVMIDNIVRKSEGAKDKLYESLSGINNRIIRNILMMRLEKLNHETKVLDRFGVAMKEFHENAGLLVVNNESGSAALAFKLLKTANALNKEKQKYGTRQFMAIFPQGERKNNFAKEDINLGVIAIAEKLGALIVPVGIAGTSEIWPAGDKPQKRVKVQLHIGEPLLTKEIKADVDPAQVLFDAIKTQRDNAYKKLAISTLDSRVPDYLY